MFSYPRAHYQRKPFPHAVVRGAWDKAVIQRCKAEADEHKRWVGGRDGKYSSHHDLPEAVRAVIQEASSAAFIGWLENLTGERRLQADPLLFGGGLHRVVPCGFLGVHVDFIRHPQARLYRRLNLLLYLTPWTDSWGGHLELHGDGVKKVAPQQNTMVVFTTDDESYHGHPHSLACPDDVTRDSIALYYYSPEGKSERTMTVYRG